MHLSNCEQRGTSLKPVGVGVESRVLVKFYHSKFLFPGKSRRVWIPLSPHPFFWICACIMNHTMRKPAFCIFALISAKTKVQMSSVVPCTETVQLASAFVFTTYIDS